ncbi:MAG: adenylyltransferase/cytidyltransferase family protein [Candidatus Thiodiazotropha taylori]|uniref:Adenylyltransferase/cytidyltransferase family protein n=1 Tax=Candidatus Thiodiazotropha taylori TaxID=2792791 RepID=A0A9E4K9C1_9GAMM|nr:adenylyltransferase/cytidyltransferase family protein [Candidatus Thiodiazotropha taylori]MCW4254936.1 adenylyltransferase/cytidyltransferase family protein [Candidatus Thiodiazotropha taylori]
MGYSERVGITFSAFDLLHAGHIKMLEEAKAQCDYLIVGLQTDPSIDRPEKNKPIQTLVERYTQLKAVKWIDEIIPYQSEQDVEDILRLYDIDVRIIGEEYRTGDFTGKKTCAELDIEIHYNKRRHQLSSSKLRKKIEKS